MRLSSLLFFPLAFACSSSSSSSSALGSACTAAGGTCHLGGDSCANVAPNGAQDCNTSPPNPGGGFCCLDSASGSGEAGSIAPDAFVSATVGVGPQSPPATCTSSAGASSFLAIGVPTGGKPTTVQDGAQSGGSPVQVQCSVVAAAGGFDVALSATVGGPNGGSLTITSPTGAGAVEATGGTGITAAFQSASEGTYQQSDCTLAFTYLGAPVPDAPPVAGGRIWGHVSCPAAVSGGGPTGTGPCDAEADFLFEQCAQ